MFLYVLYAIILANNVLQLRIIVQIVKMQTKDKCLQINVFVKLDFMMQVVLYAYHAHINVSPVKFIH